MDPRTGKGAIYWVVVGIGGTLAALVVAQFFPTIIPARATAVKL